MEQVLDRDAHLIGKALRQVGLLEDAKTYHAAGDDEGLSEIVAKALYETISHQDQLVSADEHGMPSRKVDSTEPPPKIGHAWTAPTHLPTKRAS